MTYYEPRDYFQLPHPFPLDPWETTRFEVYTFIPSVFDTQHSTTILFPTSRQPYLYLHIVPTSFSKILLYSDANTQKSLRTHFVHTIDNKT